jgi:hypothetical protein
MKKITINIANACTIKKGPVRQAVFLAYKPAVADLL